MSGAFPRPSITVFDHHAGRVIAACRVAIVAIFVIWVMIDGDAPIRKWQPALFVLIGYFVYSLIILTISFKNWWLDFLLQRATLVLDSVVFLAHVWLVLTTHTSVVVPFMGFYCFIVLSSAYRWHWQVSFAIAVVLALGYFAVSAYLLYEGHVPHYVQIARRGVYMFVLSGLLVWFAGHQRGSAVQKLTIAPDVTSPLQQALRFAREQSNAQGAALCWASEDEPLTRVHCIGTLGSAPIALNPDALGDNIMPDCLIFDRRNRREIRAGTDGRFTVETATGPVPLADVLSVNHGIVVPLNGHTGSGQILLTGIPAMTADDGTRALAIGNEIVRALDQEELASLARDAALMRVRSALARDLHDSVAQTLAGARFRLQSIRTMIADGSARDPDTELIAVEEALKDEQALLRDIIARLRRNEVTPGTRNVGPELGTLVESLSRRWQVEGRVDEPTEAVIVPTVLVYEMQQLVREGFANAVRHGKATIIRVAFARSGNQCSLSISDNGSGFADMETARPRSMTERVTSLGGTIGVFSRAGETRIDLMLPLKGPA